MERSNNESLKPPIWVEISIWIVIAIIVFSVLGCRYPNQSNVIEADKSKKAQFR